MYILCLLWQEETGHETLCEYTEITIVEDKYWVGESIYWFEMSLEMDVFGVWGYIKGKKSLMRYEQFTTTAKTK